MVALTKKNSKQHSSKNVETGMIPEAILKKYGAKIISCKKSEALFEQGENATHFFIVRTGKIKMRNYNEDGREFVQGYFEDGNSFGEPPFFNHMPYPASAVAVTDSEVWKCPYDQFIKLLRENFDVHLKVTQVLSGRLIYKSMMLMEIAVEEADHRLSTLIEYFRHSDKTMARGAPYLVPFTRQQLADMTGLRVETVIRSIKSMEQKHLLTLDDEGKILWK
ncbi:MAG: Crp/Fnr family transcriptional regulator [Bacteroidota bacterium]